MINMSKSKKTSNNYNNKHGRHVVSALHAKIVFVTKNRREAITQRVRETIRQSAVDIYAAMKVTLCAFDGEDGHIHFLVEYPSSLALSRLVNSLKGLSSRRVRQRKSPEVTKCLWGEHFWSPSYFVGSCGGAPIEIVKQYVENQRKR
jgi:putative transposase